MIIHKHVAPLHRQGLGFFVAVGLGDFRFTAGTALNSSVSLRTLRVNADWFLLQAPQTEAGVTLGGRALSSSFGDTGRSLVNEGSTVAPAMFRPCWVGRKTNLTS